MFTLGWLSVKKLLTVSGKLLLQWILFRPSKWLMLRENEKGGGEEKLELARGFLTGNTHPPSLSLWLASHIFHYILSVVSLSLPRSQSARKAQILPPLQIRTPGPREKFFPSSELLPLGGKQLLGPLDWGKMEKAAEISEVIWAVCFLSLWFHRDRRLSLK